MSHLTPIFDGAVSSGKLSLDDKSQFLNYLYSLEGKRVQIKVERMKHKRSLNQNSYLWGVCYKLIADHTGDDEEDIHIALKYHLTKKRFIGNLIAPASTKRMDTIEFTEYIEKVRRWAAEELSITIPDPNQVEV